MSLPAELVSRSPKVLRVHDVLTPQECARVVECARPGLERASVTDRDGRRILDPIRRASSSELGGHEDEPVLRALDHRLARAVGLPLEHGEPLHVVRYLPGDGVGPHYDAFDPDEPGQQSLLGSSGQRVVTAIVHLALASDGGGMLLPRTNQRIDDELGGAILLHNVTSEGEPDPMALHCTCNVLDGARWVAVKWWRERPFSE